MNRLRFWRCHISGFNEEAMMGLCPSCRNWGVKILRKEDGDEFVCLRCDLRGKGIEDFIEQATDYHPLWELRKLVREERNKRILEVRAYERGEEEISSDEISSMVRDIEARRTHVWIQLARMAYPHQRGRVTELFLESTDTVENLKKLLAQELNLPPAEVEGYLDSLEEFGDIEVTENNEESLRIKVNDLWRNGL